MPDLTTATSDEDLGFPSQERQGLIPAPIPPRRPKPKLTRLKVNLSTPLVVKTAGGENMAGPGDVVGHIGRKDVMMSKDLFLALLGKEKYDDLVKKEMLKIRIGKRLDDGLPPFTEEEIGKQKEEIEEVMKNAQEREGPEFDPNDINQRVQIIDSTEGPPTIKPDEYATIIPGPMLPIPEDTEDELEGGEGGSESEEKPPPGSQPPLGETPEIDNTLPGSETQQGQSIPWTSNPYAQQ